MPATTTYYVDIEIPHVRHNQETQFVTFAAAERLARYLHIRYGAVVKIRKTVSSTSGQTESKIVATVSSDAYGRVWTDCMIYGEALI